jgi:Transcriptional regulator
MQAMEWGDFRVLLAIARGGTLAAASRRLGVDQTTVARRLAAAEAALGTRLFERVEGALRPTKPVKSRSTALPGSSGRSRRWSRGSRAPMPNQPGSSASPRCRSS